MTNTCCDQLLQVITSIKTKLCSLYNVNYIFVFVINFCSLWVLLLVLCCRQTVSESDVSTFLSRLRQEFHFFTVYAVWADLSLKLTDLYLAQQCPFSAHCICLCDNCSVVRYKHVGMYRLDVKWEFLESSTDSALVTASTVFVSSVHVQCRVTVGISISLLTDQIFSPPPAKYFCPFLLDVAMRRILFKTAEFIELHDLSVRWMCYQVVVTCDTHT